MMRRIMGVLVLVGLFVALSTWTARAERLVGQYRGPTDKLTTIKETEDTSIDSSGTGADTGGSAGESEGRKPGTDGGSGDPGAGDGGTTPGGGEDPGGGGEDPGGGGEDPGGGGATPPPSGGDGSAGGDGSGAPDEGSSGREPPPDSGGGGSSTPGGSVGPGSVSGVPGSGPKGKTDTSEAFKLWSFYWEHNRERLIHKLATSRRDRVNFAPWGSSWVLGRGKKTFRKVNPITQTAIQEKILPLLVRRLNDKNPLVRDAAAIALGKVGGKDVVPLLIERALKDGDAEVREDATLALGLTGEPEAYPTLLKLLRGDGPRVTFNQRCFAAFAMGILGHADGSKALLAEMKKAVRSRDRENEQLLASMALGIGALGQEDAIKELGSYLTHPRVSKLVKSYVASALGKLAHKDALKPLNRAWKKSDPMVKGSIVLAMGSFPLSPVVKFLQSEGLKDGEGQVQNFSAVSLARIGSVLPVDEPSRKSILVTLETKAEKPARNPTLAQFSALGLGMVGQGSVATLFREMAVDRKHKDTTRSSMALTLGLLGDGGSAKEILGILQSRGLDPKLRSYAALSLGFLGDPNNIPKLQEEYRRAAKRNSRDVMRGCVMAIGLLGDAGDVDFLIDDVLTESEYPTVRGAVAIAFGVMREATAIDKLARLAESRSHEDSVEDKAFAIAALGYLADKDAYPRLSRIFENCNYRLEYPQLIELLRIL